MAEWAEYTDPSSVIMVCDHLRDVLNALDEVLDERAAALLEGIDLEGNDGGSDD